MNGICACLFLQKSLKQALYHFFFTLERIKPIEQCKKFPKVNATNK